MPKSVSGVFYGGHLSNATPTYIILKKMNGETLERLEEQLAIIGADVLDISHMSEEQQRTFLVEHDLQLKQVVVDYSALPDLELPELSIYKNKSPKKVDKSWRKRMGFSRYS